MEYNSVFDTIGIFLVLVTALFFGIIGGNSIHDNRQDLNVRCNYVTYWLTMFLIVFLALYLFFGIGVSHYGIHFFGHVWDYMTSVRIMK